MGKRSFHFSREQKEKILEKIEEKAEAIAIDAREKLTEKYLNIVKRFYFEKVFYTDDGKLTYEPRYYYRHYKYETKDEALLNSGLGRTFAPYYRYRSQSRQEVYTGGIRINTDNMYTNYVTGNHSISYIQECIIYSFTHGWHGPVDDGIKGTLNPLEELIGYKKTLIRELRRKYEV